MNLTGYGKDDIIKVLERTYVETEENRDRALKLYDHMEQAMTTNKGDLVVLSQMADRYLEQASRQTEILVRLAAVMQKLKQFGGDTEGKTMTDVNALLQKLDENKVTPFTIGGKDGKKTEKIESTHKLPVVPEDPKEGDVQLEAEL